MSNKLKEIILITDGYGEKSITSYDPHTGNQLNVYKQAGSIAAHTLQVLGDCYLIAADQTRPRLHLWPLNSQTPLSTIRLPTPGKVSALACTPDGKFAVAAINEKLFLWQTCNGHLLATLNSHFQMITTVKFNADGSIFASAAEDNLIFVWSLGGCSNSRHLPDNSCKPLYTFCSHSRPVKDICFGNFYKRSILCSVSLDKSLKMYDTSTGHLLLSLIFSEPLTSVCIDNSENFVFIGTMSGSIRQFTTRNPPRIIDYVATNKDLKEFKSHTATISSLSVSPDCTMLLSGDDSGKVCVWNISSGIVTKEFFHKGRIGNAIFSIAFENYKIDVLTPSISFATLQWTTEKDNSGYLEIICEDGSKDFLNYSDFVKDNETRSELLDKRSLLAENEELKRINNALMKKFLTKVLKT